MNNKLSPSQEETEAPARHDSSDYGAFAKNFCDDQVFAVPKGKLRMEDTQAQELEISQDSYEFNESEEVFKVTKTKRPGNDELELAIRKLTN
jgi:hypothetical protein